MTPFVKRLFVCGSATLLVVACGSGPSKSDAMEIIKRDVKDDVPCTLPLDVIQQLKMQYASKGACVPNEASQKTRDCIDSLVANSITQSKSQAYMVDWEDSASMANVYDRHGRNIIFRTCVEMGDLRDGRFACATAKPDHVVRVKESGPDKAEVFYDRELAFRPSLAAIEKACGGVTRPPQEGVVSLIKVSGKWQLAPPAQ
ncbi:MAG TPA: hypothetical protein VIF62_22060 [Labilithrix sp.]